MVVFTSADGLTSSWGEEDFSRTPGRRLAGGGAPVMKVGAVPGQFHAGAPGTGRLSTGRCGRSRFVLASFIGFAFYLGP